MIHVKRFAALVAAVLLFAPGCGGGAAEPANPGGGPGPGGGGGGQALAWNPVPAFVFSVGTPAAANLRDYLNDPGGGASITLDGTLPSGLRLEDGAILGTPTAPAGADHRATATEASPGTATVTSDPFHVEVVAASGTIGFERATPEQIGIHIPLQGSPPAATTATVRYKPVAEATWRTGHPLVRIHPEWNAEGAPVLPVDAFAGSIFDLSPATPYDVEVTITQPGGTPQLARTVVSTRAVPPAAGPGTARVTPGADLQAAFDALGPGDVLELANGTYDVSGLHVDVSGTASAPIVIRGEAGATAVLRSDGNVLQIQRASHLVLEDLTLQGTGTDSGTSASSIGVSIWSGATQEFLTFRRLHLVGVDKGILAYGTVRSVLVYHCTLQGNNAWNAQFIESNLTWNDDGIRLCGEGNCAFENTLHGFGDSFAVASGVFSAGVYYYRNRITMTGDDAFEGDYATRNIAFYYNHVTNCAVLLSLDPLWGGPLYCFRNVAVNTMRGPFKFNNTQSGFLVYNNTIVRTDGTTGWGWVQFDNGSLRNWAYRNNLLVYHGGTSLLALESSGNDPIDFTHNGWYPDGQVAWTGSGSSWSSLAGAFAGLPPTTPVFSSATARHEGDIVLPREPFQDAIPLGADHLSEVTALYVPVLAAGSPARGSGAAIPNITDGHNGAAPDMGAIIAGRAPPAWGAP